MQKQSTLRSIMNYKAYLAQNYFSWVNLPMVLFCDNTAATEIANKLI